jgi:hypothetical protein
MKKAKSYAKVTRRFYRPELSSCPECQRHLRRTSTLSQRQVVTLKGVVKVTHAGYRCPDPHCRAAGRTYRSAAADALALPSFTFGLDVVVLAGQLHFGKHQTLDEAHQHLSERLALVGVSISRREVLYLFDAFTTLLRAASDASQDHEWREQVKNNQGIIVSIDGIKPDEGNETVYVVRDGLTGRLLAADNVTDNSVERLKQLLMPVVALNLPVLGTISDAQETEVMALCQLWPDVPHQTCQFHALREASRAGFQVDGQMKAQMRKQLQPKIRSVRQQIRKQAEQASGSEAEQLAILDEYALGAQTALNLEGKLPFEYAGVAAAEALDEVATSLSRLEKKGELSVSCPRGN